MNLPTPRPETMPATFLRRFGAASGSALDDAVADQSPVNLLPSLILAWFEIMRLESAREGGLGRGRLLYSPALSTGSANDGVVFGGQDLIPANWRQGRGIIEQTHTDDGLVWEMVAPGDTHDAAPMLRAVTYNAATGDQLRYMPLQAGVTILLVPGIARSLVVDLVTLTAVQTYIGGVTTYAQLASDWAASYEAGLLAEFDGDAGTIPVTFPGGPLYLTQPVLVEYVQAGGAAVGWNAATRTVTVSLDLAGGGDSLANIKAALLASASGAQYVVQARDTYGSDGSGDITLPGFCQCIGGQGSAMRRARLATGFGADADLEFEARDFGADAQPVQLGYVHDAAAEPPVVTVNEKADVTEIVVAAKIGTALAIEILQALRDSADAMRWIAARLLAGSDGSGTPVAFALSPLVFGEDSDALVAIAGTQPSTGILGLTDDAVTVDFPALGVTHPAGSSVNMLVRIGGVVHQITAPVIA
jgi:hypothetical protein